MAMRVQKAEKPPEDRTSADRSAKPQEADLSLEELEAKLGVSLDGLSQEQPPRVATLPRKRP